MNEVDKNHSWSELIKDFLAKIGTNHDYKRKIIFLMAFVTICFVVSVNTPKERQRPHRYSGTSMNSNNGDTTINEMYKDLLLSMQTDLKDLKQRMDKQEKLIMLLGQEAPRKDTPCECSSGQTEGAEPFPSLSR